MKTASDQNIIADREWPGPLYLDASALVKLYLPEPGSDTLDAAIQGRSDNRDLRSKVVKGSYQDRIERPALMDRGGGFGIRP